MQPRARVRIGHERFERSRATPRHGGKTIFIGHFISLVRAFAPFIAGSSGMRYRAFVPYSILGTGLWASAHVLIGYFVSRSIDAAAKYAGEAPPARHADRRSWRSRCVVSRHFRVAENRARGRALDGSPRRRPAGWSCSAGVPAAAAIPLGRVTPGGTFGLEFTSLMAALAVSLLC